MKHKNWVIIIVFFSCRDYYVDQLR